LHEGLRSIDEKAIMPSSISSTLTMLPAMNNHGDTGDNTTWVAVAGAEHSEAEGPPRMEVDHDLRLANQRQQPRREWPPLGQNVAEDELPGASLPYADLLVPDLDAALPSSPHAPDPGGSRRHPSEIALPVTKTARTTTDPSRSSSSGETSSFI
jgi:hypothetical protein